MATAKSCLFNQLYEFRPALSTSYRYSNVYTGARIFNIYSGTDTIESFNTLQDAVEAGLYPANQLLSSPISKQQMLRILHGFQGFNLFQRFNVNSQYDDGVGTFGVNGSGFTRGLNENIVDSNNLQKRASTGGSYRLSVGLSSRTEQYSTFGSNYLYNSGYEINASKFGGVSFLNGRMNKLDPITFSVSSPTAPLVNPYTCGAEIVCGAESSNSTQSQMQEINASIFRQNLTGGFSSGLCGSGISFRSYFIEINNSYYVVFTLFQRLQNWLLNTEVQSPELIQTSNVLSTAFPEDYGLEEFEIENLGIISIYRLQKLVYGPPEGSVGITGTGTVSFELEVGIALLEYGDFSPDYNYPPKLN